MNTDISSYNASQSTVEYQQICALLAETIDKHLPEAESRIWHSHPVWFLEANPTVGYSKQKAGIRLMFWSGASFDEAALVPGTGKFKDASIVCMDLSQISMTDLNRWLKKARAIQWDYKNVAMRKGKLERLKQGVAPVKCLN